MIPAPTRSAQPEAAPARWQALWRDAVRDPRELLEMLGLEADAGRLSPAAAGQFPLRVPRGFVARMRRDDPSISEVLLSGGDPLSLSTAKLAEFTDGLRGIPHIRRLRLHTRLPVVLPERVDAELVAWLRGLPWPVVVVAHANHGNEIGA